jgi:hypothetical protein
LTKKQIIIVSVAAVVLIGLIIAVSVSASDNTKVADNQIENQDIQYPERRQIPTVEDKSDNSETEKDSNSKNTDSTNSGNSTSGSKSIDPASNLKSALPSGTSINDLYKKTGTAAPPETSGYPVPKKHHFFDIEGSSKPGDKDQAELMITLDINANFEKQLQELKQTIEPVLGSDTTEEILAYMKKKTSYDVELDRWWKTDSKDIKVSSGVRTPLIIFYSWKI